MRIPATKSREKGSAGVPHFNLLNTKHTRPNFVHFFSSITYSSIIYHLREKKHSTLCHIFPKSDIQAASFFIEGGAIIFLE
jgi:hypothetical protein